jgi:hypothetical protein
VTSFVAGPDVITTPEAADWYQTRYRDYAFLTVHITPAAASSTTTMTVRAVTDRGAEIDRVDITRTAGATATATQTVSSAARHVPPSTGCRCRVRACPVDLESWMR